MKVRCHIHTLIAIFTLGGCARTITEEEQVVQNSPTNPNVSQRAVSQIEDEPKPGHPRYSPPRAQPTSTLHVPTGSLFNPEQSIGLYERHANFKVGDMILVKLDEKTQSEKSLDFNTDKNTSFDLAPVTLKLGGIQVEGDDVEVEHEQDSEFASSAQTKQSNSMSGSITVYVTGITPAGNLLVTGEKWITMNRGKEYIRFSGEVRKKDVDESNTVLSSKVGNALIEYSGTGDLQDNQRPSVIGKLFSIFG
ncbi:flagellar biosynthesis protein FlgH [Alteromonas mediterranea]|uniref:flagellar basal body L-ring protein FlgH n=1 Tax=Alteromonas mediterranea TaxID=314275 RepID=UPI00090458FB|nr:flagellar basal body L-ring protein FlgH [Alteromonas mediterranea]APD92870.1 flagellar biosynthesis protein FlgH [Alteromonas mediterranea]APD96484.1 flagellar biosynthesis protein FlgH [Alteromonas mediterranea]QDG33587.1 flagellar biosynthesis protein FlgH [Alteromonas mediterranea]QGX60533.1 flagellar biosynthesis protein FlgH [Alteromonas mediterranea]